jgi:putative acetyltransferase
VFVIREEQPGDEAPIRDVNRQAFGSDVEARLVDQLWDDGEVIESLVAVEEGQIVGYILFSDLPIETEHGLIPAVAMAPMAVSPEMQRQGIGSALVRRGLDICRERGKAVAVVVGHREYYQRFGFSADLAKQLQSPYAGESCMAVELIPGALDGVLGIVRYPRAFDVFS